MSEANTASGPACGATCGVTKERERQKSVAREIALRAEVTDRSLGNTGVAMDELFALADSLAEILPTRVFVSQGSGATCDSILLLAGTNEPCWFEVREGVAEGAPTHDEETYLRVAISPLGRYYSLQEVRFTAQRDDGGIWIEERHLVGVEDRRLQLFVKAAQGYLRKRKWIGLDAAFLSESLPDPTGSETARVGTSPTLWNVLFESTTEGCTRGEYLVR